MAERTTRKELDELLAQLNSQRHAKGERTLSFYITNPGDHGVRYQLMWHNTGSDVSRVMNAGEMASALRLAIKLG